MSALSDFTENKLIDFLLRGQALGITGATAAAGTGPANTYVALLTANATDAGGGTEVSGGGYARATVASTLANWAGTQGAGTTVASSGNTGQTSNNLALSFGSGNTSAAWGVVTGIAVYDSLAAGNMLFQGALSANKTINSGDPVPTFAAGALTFTLA